MFALTLARTALRRSGRCATTVRGTDMRFAGGLLPLQPPALQPAPFAVTVQVGADHHILREQIGP